MEKHVKRLGWGLYVIAVIAAFWIAIVDLVEYFNNPVTQALAICALAVTAYGLGYLILGESA